MWDVGIKIKFANTEARDFHVNHVVITGHVYYFTQGGAAAHSETLFMAMHISEFKDSIESGVNKIVESFRQKVLRHDALQARNGLHRIDFLRTPMTRALIRGTLALNSGAGYIYGEIPARYL